MNKTINGIDFRWTFDWSLPPRSDVRWVIAGLLFSYLLLGIFVLGFGRKPEQILAVMALAAFFEIVFSGFVRGKVVFPLSALITSLSLCILLNYTYSFRYLWIPVFVAIASKYVVTLRGRHFFNPALFGIVFSIVFLGDVISMAPAYQWYGSAESAWVMGWFVLTAALLLFVFRIDRAVLALSFLFFFTLATAVRAYIMSHVVHFETLFVGALTSPAFYLFAFYMITDPATSPPNRREQVMVGFCIAALDLVLHKMLSYYTFFYAGIMVAGVRFLWKHWQFYRENPAAWRISWLEAAPRRGTLALAVVLPLYLGAWRSLGDAPAQERNWGFRLEAVPTEHSGLGWAQSNILQEADPRVAHVAKWVMSVGDAVACADVDNDGLQDVFLTQTLKAAAWQAKLYLNKGDFHFEKTPIPDLERYLGDAKTHGLPSAALFFDYDNDGDQDLLVGFSFGYSHLFENRLLPDGRLNFVEKSVDFFQNERTVCLAANVFDYNRDGAPDLFVSNTLPPYMTDYLPEKVPFNLFNLPPARYDGDRRMLHFMHESWQNANNGGKNYVVANMGRGRDFRADTAMNRSLPETRWSLAIGTSDLNGDDWPDLYIANDFGRDDCYLNQGGTALRRQQGRFFGEIGLDTYKGMNTTVSDFDGDGQEDVYISNVYHEMQAEGSLLWANKTSKGADKVDLKERAAQMNILNIHRFGWGATACDLDLDGFPDVVQTNGMTDASWDSLYPERSDYWYYQMQVARTGPEIHSYADKWADIRGRSIYENEADCIFMNQQGQHFTDAAAALGFSHRENTRAVAAADFDNDGDADLLVTDQYGAPKLYRNNQTKARQWAGLVLCGNGASCSRDAVGTKVWLRYKQNGKEKSQFRELHALNGFSSQGDPRLLFGFGDETIEQAKIRIRWTDGTEQVMDLPGTGKYVKITQNQPFN
jgi:enediyne biosynthesis protein E4